MFSRNEVTGFLGLFFLFSFAVFLGRRWEVGGWVWLRGEEKKEERGS
jgi:hypothetical protein